MVKAFIRFVAVALGSAFVGLLIIVLGLILSGAESNANPLVPLGALLFGASPLVAIIDVVWRRRNAGARRRNELITTFAKDIMRRRFLERQRLIDSVDRHRSALTRNLDRARRRNDYGIIISDGTDDALLEFFSSMDLDLGLLDFKSAAEVVFEQLDYIRKENSGTGFDPSALPEDGHAFEHWVAEALRGFGWNAEVTSASGDQGIDVVAEKEGRKIGLQCKLYGSPVGNGAIQEAHSGKIFYGLDAVGVLTNATFTSSAKELAAVTGVFMLSHHDVPTLDTVIFGSRRAT